MRKPVIILGAATLALAASTAWLAFQLHAARAELSALRAGPVSTPMGSTRTLAVDEVVPAATTPGQAPSARNSKPPAARAGQPDDRLARVRGSLEAHIPRMRAMLEDPAKREQYLREARANLRRDMPRLDEHLKLTPDEYDSFVDLLARQELRYQDWIYECALDPGCDPMPATGYRHAQANKQELRELLGADKAQRYADYRDNEQERQVVTQWRGELPDSLRLTDDQAEKLVGALGEERRRITLEWEQGGGKAEEFGNMHGFIAHSSTAQDVDQFLEQAGELQRRQRQRAAQILTAGQLDVFTQQQKYALDMARGSWEHHRELTRKAAN